MYLCPPILRHCVGMTNANTHRSTSNNGTITFDSLSLMVCSCVRPKMAMYLFALLSPLCTYGCVNRWPIRMIQLGKKRPICRHHSPLCPAFSPREHSALPGHHEEDRGSILIQEHQQMHSSSSPPLKLTHFWSCDPHPKYTFCLILVHEECWSFVGVLWISQNVWSFAIQGIPKGPNLNFCVWKPTRLSLAPANHVLEWLYVGHILGRCRQLMLWKSGWPPIDCVRVM